MIFMSLYAYHIRKLRKARAKIVLNHLVTAVELRLPIVSYLQSVSIGENNDIRRRLQSLAVYIEYGMPLGSAFYNSSSELDLRIPSLIDAAERTGQLQQVLREIKQLMLTPEFAGSVVFLEDYDLQLARWLVTGVDVWLNNPVAPPLVLRRHSSCAFLIRTQGTSRGILHECGWPPARLLQDQEHRSDDRLGARAVADPPARHRISF